MELQTKIADALYEVDDKSKAAELYRKIQDGYSRLVEGSNVDPFILDQAARFFLNCPDPEVKDGQRGYELAKLANDAMKVPSPHYMHTMALAHSAASNQPDAVKTMKSAIDLLPDNSGWSKRFKEDLEKINE